MSHLLYSEQRPQLDILANAWLSAGAKTVSIWHHDVLLDQWPADSMLRPPELIAPIQLGNEELGELHVSGWESQSLHNPLTVETQLVSHLMELETELGDAQEVQRNLFPQKTPSTLR